MTLLFVIIWLICGVFGALIFQSKNREPWKGAVLGFVLGVIGLFIAALFSKRQPVAEPQISARERISAWEREQ